MGKQNNKRFISRETPLKYDFLMFFPYLVVILLLFFLFFCLSAVHRGQEGIEEIQIIEMKRIDLRIEFDTGKK